MAKKQHKPKVSISIERFELTVITEHGKVSRSGGIEDLPEALEAAGTLLVETDRRRRPKEPRP